MNANGHVIALCGGVGGAKLAFGLTHLLPPDDISVIVNTADDFEHLGLTICPDLDTVAYTLAGLSERQRGWGLAGESWAFMAQLEKMGGETWFNLGDKDLAMHVERTRMLRAGHSLSDTVVRLTTALGLRHRIIPMSDQPFSTIVDTDQGRLSFQHYFVREQCRPVVRAIHFDDGRGAVPSPGFAAALARPDIAAVIICPSNPYLSIDPILALPGVRDALVAIDAPVVSVSPIVGGHALKGPASKMMTELGATPGTSGIAEHYRGLIDGLVIDQVDADDAAPVRAMGIEPLVAQTVMSSDEDRIGLARPTLAFAAKLARAKPCPA